MVKHSNVMLFTSRFFNIRVCIFKQDVYHYVYLEYANFRVFPTFLHKTSYISEILSICEGCCNMK